MNICESCLKTVIVTATSAWKYITVITLNVKLHPCEICPNNESTFTIIEDPHDYKGIPASLSVCDSCLTKNISILTRLWGGKSLVSRRGPEFIHQTQCQECGTNTPYDYLVASLPRVLTDLVEELKQ